MSPQGQGREHSHVQTVKAYSVPVKGDGVPKLAPRDQQKFTNIPLLNPTELVARYQEEEMKNPEPSSLPRLPEVI